MSGLSSPCAPSCPLALQRRTRRCRAQGAGAFVLATAVRSGLVRGGEARAGRTESGFREERPDGAAEGSPGSCPSARSDVTPAEPGPPPRPGTVPFLQPANGVKRSWLSTNGAHRRFP